LLALGRRGTPRRLNVPGEDLAKVAYKLIDAEAYRNRRVLVVGGGDSAVEAATGLAHQEGTQVTLSYRKPELLRIKQRKADRIAEAIAAGRIDFRGSSTVQTIDQDTVVLDGADGPLIIQNDDVFILAGGIPPFGFFTSSGNQVWWRSGRPADRWSSQFRYRLISCLLTFLQVHSSPSQK
jgi:thioredoxin reductase